MEKDTIVNRCLVESVSQITLEVSYAHCRRVVRQAGSSFSYPMLLLPRDKRRSMYALYAFLRHSDDLADADTSQEQRRQALAAWRVALNQGLSGDAHHTIFPALADTIRRYDIPRQYLDDVLDGVEMDLNVQVMETFAELEKYCYRVASAVGLACIHIWGFDGQDALQSARNCGIAFQLTNILRDLKEDARRGRVYLPLEDLQRFGYSLDDLRQGRTNAQFFRLIDFQIGRAESFYERSSSLVHDVHPDARRVLQAMVRTYRAILEKIKRSRGDVFQQRLRLSGWRQTWIMVSSLWNVPAR